MIIDASVAIKLFTPEEHSDQAERLLQSENLSAPDLLAAEVANAFWRMIRQGKFAAPPTRLSLLETFVPDLVPSVDLLQDSLALAVALDHPAYDCFYLALAIRRDERLITADRRFLTAIATSTYAHRAISLADWKPV